MERLTDPMKVVIAFFVVQHFMRDIDANPKTTNAYKAQLFDRIMSELQINYFRDIHPQECFNIVEECKTLFNEMKSQISNTILKDVDSKSGFGIDKGLGEKDVDIKSDVFGIYKGKGGD